MTTEAPKLPPHDLEAEQAILGAALLDGSRLDAVREVIEETDFYAGKHRAIFSAMCRLSDQGEPIDQVTLSEQLQADGRLEAVGGRAYLVELWASVASPSNAVTHARLVRDHARRRRLIKAAQQLADEGYKAAEPVDALIEAGEKELFSIRHRQNGSGFLSIGDLSSKRLDHLEALSKRKSEVTGIPTGFASLDRLTAGLQSEDLIIIGARPSMGKTSLALAIARHVAIELSRPVALFSLEMAGGQITDRIISAEARVDALAMRTGRLDAAAWWRVAEVSQRLQRTPLYVDDCSVLSMAQLRSRARRVKAQHGADLIVVDYLQLMQTPKGAESRQQGMADISRDLKLLARELQVPVVALAQLNRELERRPDKRPNLADLRDSGAIEQDADVVMFVYRDEVYNPESPDRGIAELLIRKHRNGPTGEVRLVFVENYALFSDLAVTAAP